MELLIPGLIVLLATVAVCFFIIPRIAPEVLIGASTLVLIYAIYQHINRFGVMEYERSTWQNNLKGYLSYILFALVIFGAYGAFALNTGERRIFSPIEALTTPKVGGGFDNVIETAVSRVNQLMRKGRISE